MSPDLPDLADERFVSLTTFRRSGAGVATAVWIARNGEDLIVTTPATSGKVKRLRNDPRVEMRPCSRSGHVADDAPAVTGVAEIVPDSDTDRGIIRRKYGLEYRVVMFIERLAKRRQEPRLTLRIKAAPAL